MAYIVVDVEADGPIPHKYSMVSFGAVLVDKEGKLDKTFYGETRPISGLWDSEALAISGFTREEHELFDDPSEVMKDFALWINEVKGKRKPIFISDNPCFDWQFINYYFHYFLGYNPFGYSGQRIGDKFQGFYNDPYKKWKQFRDTTKYPHNHNPVSDAQSNASALLYLYKQGFKLFS